MSKLFDAALDKIKENKKVADSGNVNCIPFEWLPKLRKVLPGIIRGTNWIISAASGVGKTQFSKFMFVYKPIEWVKAHPELGIKYKILYFALEESKEEFMFSMISSRLYSKYSIQIDILTLQSMYEISLSDYIVEKIEECKDYFSDLDQYIEIIDSISNPTGIFKYVRQYSVANGTHYYYNFKTDKEKNNIINWEEYNKLPDITAKDYAYSHYIPTHPNEYIGVVVDHGSLIQPEQGAPTVHEAMSKMSAEYGRKQIAKHYKYFFVFVQQQAAAGEQAEYTKMGGKIEEKFKPSLAGLGDNKLTQRDALVVLGLFAPARYNIQKYNGYDITKLADNFRSVEILKNRIGSGYVEDALYFDGRVNEFKELPSAQDMNDKDYEYVIQKRLKK
jgi:hypothetical protein